MRRNRRAAKPIAPRPKIAIEAGSGTTDGGGALNVVMSIVDVKFRIGLLNDRFNVTVRFAAVASRFPSAKLVPAVKEPENVSVLLPPVGVRFVSPVSVSITPKKEPNPALVIVNAVIGLVRVKEPHTVSKSGTAEKSPLPLVFVIGLIKRSVKSDPVVGS